MKTRTRIALSAAALVVLVGCQTTDGNTRKDSASAAPAIVEESQRIWVDLTPYPKASKDAALVESMASSPSEKIGSWSVRMSDGTIRQALSRWADEAGWSFNTSHYELSVDIPLTAEATLVERGTFQQAVQAMVEAVALSDHPIRACFYQNKVLRIINFNSSCNARMN